MGPVSKAVHGQNVALNTFTELLFRRCKEEIFIFYTCSSRLPKGYDEEGAVIKC